MFTALMWLVAAWTGCASADENTISVLTYNVHGLPSFITGDDTESRIEQISSKIGAYDIVGLQEDFVEENHKALSNAVSYPTEVRFDDPVMEGRAYGTGLSTFAKLEEVERRQEYFSTCNGLLDSGSDCLASKGFQIVRLRVGTAEVDVYNTHLDAGTSEADATARVSQVQQIIGALNGYSAGRAVILMGDTNLRESRVADAPLIAMLKANAGLSDACEELACPQLGSIDKVLIRSSETLALDPTLWTEEQRFRDAAGAPLSDHNAYRVNIHWTVTETERVSSASTD